ncbi:expressed unknown protein [Ectocarpus siliculosus]|uniref:Uncharacterized protein n=1 Tax=Ectocarpus siliculosus TaxID=2880 RepID=D7FNR8_ECTSI|nr:expressed unknown protein [Ectocarpus siliculosus]|eukprot:CBJ26079.1 expressed unknown protein [Ectocarpus siliculosus]
MSSPSYLTRRQRSYASHASHNNPHSLEPFSAALIPNHERGTLQTFPGAGGGAGAGGGPRGRRRGSPFAALSEAYKPARAPVFSRPRRRDGGEVLGLRSSCSFVAWPRPGGGDGLLPADPRHVQQKRPQRQAGAEVQIITTTAAKKPVLLLPRKKTDENAVLGRWVSSSSSTEEAASTAATTPPPTPPPPPSRSHRKSVSWPEDVIRSVHRFPVAASQADVYSPDLQAVEIAKELAVRARNPELRRAALQVDYCRRHAAQVVRSMTSAQNGGLDGVEEACRLYGWREETFLRETDELVRSIVVEGGEKEVWRLKSSFRAARRRMEDAESD